MDAAADNESLTAKNIEATIYPNPVTSKLIVTLEYVHRKNKCHHY
jgi:hypothetical protein